MIRIPDGRAGVPTRVSVIIPCYNGERYLRETIESVLAQSHDALEIVVVDDGSTDGTADVVRAFEGAVRYERQRHTGAAVARNRGVALARGDVLGFIDADDLWMPCALKRLLAPLERDPGVGMAVGQMEQFVSPELQEADFKFSPAPVAARMCGTVLVRRTDFERAGNFSPVLETGEFIDWISRAEAVGVNSVAIPEVVLRRRLHHTNHGVTRRDAQQDYVRVVKAALDRRRAMAASRGVS